MTFVITIIFCLYGAPGCWTMTRHLEDVQSQKACDQAVVEIGKKTMDLWREKGLVGSIYGRCELAGQQVGPQRREGQD